jgi:hypothetical protein
MTKASTATRIKEVLPARSPLILFTFAI